MEKEKFKKLKRKLSKSKKNKRMDTTGIQEKMKVKLVVLVKILKKTKPAKKEKVIQNRMVGKKLRNRERVQSNKNLQPNQKKKKMILFHD